MSVEPLAPSPGRASLARDGLATAPPGITHAGDRPIEVTLLTITDVGRQALGDM